MPSLIDVAVLTGGQIVILYANFHFDDNAALLMRIVTREASDSACRRANPGALSGDSFHEQREHCSELA